MPAGLFSSQCSTCSAFGHDKKTRKSIAFRGSFGDLLGYDSVTDKLWVAWLFHTQLVVMFFNKSQLTMLLSLSLNIDCPLQLDGLVVKMSKSFVISIFPETRRIDR